MQHFNPEINAPQLLTSNKKILHQLVLHFLMCISCSNEDMAEFKDEPKHHLRSTASLLQIAQFLNHQLYLENTQTQQECLVKSIQSRLRPSLCYPSEVTSSWFLTVYFRQTLSRHNRFFSDVTHL